MKKRNKLVNFIPGSMSYSGNTIQGRVFWRHGRLSFPARDWDDAVVLVLDWWVAACQNLAKKKKRENFLFMEGPYFVAVTPDGTETLKLDFLRQGVNSCELKGSGSVSRRSLFEDVYGAAEKVLADCKKRNFSSREVKGLERRVVRFAAVFRK